MMKTFILFTSNIPESTANAKKCLASFNSFSTWDPELYDGCTPHTLSNFEEKYNFNNDRARFRPEHEFFKTKKSCFYSHFSLWIKCVEINEPIAIVEHDTYCKSDLPEGFIFDGIVQFTSESLFKSHRHNYANAYNQYKKQAPGLYSAELFSSSNTKHRLRWGYTIAGNTGYGITPASAKILIDDCYQHGWQQNDLLMSTDRCVVEHLIPSPIVYNPSWELQTSRNKGNIMT